MATERLVLDASFALEAILPTSAAWQSEAFDLFDRIASQDVEARVPLLFFAEVAAVITRKVRARRLDDAEAAEFLMQLDALGLHIDLSLDGALQLFTQARQWQAGAYDAINLLRRISFSRHRLENCLRKMMPNVWLSRNMWFL